ncbi:MAG: sialate O-acetylesterase [Candidatus Scatosoma sp.]
MKKTDIIVFGGQSNMQGQTESCPNGGSVPFAREYRYKTDELIPLAHPVGEDFGDFLLAAHEGHGSLVPAFCKAYRERTGGEVVAIHAAKGATVINDWKEDGARYAFALKKILSGIRKVGAETEIGSINCVWLQGESDAIAGTKEEEYLRALKAYKNALKRDVKISRFGIIRVGFFTTEEERDKDIMRAQERAAAEDGDFVMLTRITGRLSRDPSFLNPFAAGHYANAGMELLGRTAGDALARAALGEKNVADAETVTGL